MKKIIKKYIARWFSISAVCDALDEAFRISKERKWEFFYVAIDLHKTVLYPDYDKKFVNNFYKHASEVLQIMSGRPDMKLIMYTCSHPEEIEQYLTFFKEHGITFLYVNKNPDVTDTLYGDFSGKPYMNVLLEDKAGFDPNEDWAKLKKTLKKYPFDYLKNERNKRTR